MFSPETGALHLALSPQPLHARTKALGNGKVSGLGKGDGGPYERYLTELDGIAVCYSPFYGSICLFWAIVYWPYPSNITARADSNGVAVVLANILPCVV